MISVTVWTPEKTVKQGGPELLSAPGTKWVDVCTPNEELMQELATQFHLHRLVVEDCLHRDQRPKLEEYPNQLFLVLQAFSCPGEKVDELDLHEMHYILGPDWLITVHDLESESIAEARRRIFADPAGTLARGPDFVAYLIADAMMDRSFPLLDTFNDELDELENKIFEKPTPEHLERIFALKRTLGQLRRVLSPQRDVVVMLTRNGVAHISERTTLYFRDVYDHLVRIYEQIDADRDILGNAMDAYLSMVANRTGEIGKQLTLFATVFLPLSFVVGFFGMNFENLSHFGWYITMWVTVIAIPVAVLLWFRRRGWLGW
ncbi:MAG: magnesium/cobalt transporter CorA [Myxococcaceae bacterium]